MKITPDKGALSVSKGVKQPSSVSNKSVDRFLQKKKQILSADEYVDGIIKSDRIILSQAITIIESTLPEHFALSQEIIAKSLPFSNNSLRIGITGVPGVGKSSFIEEFGSYLTRTGKKLAVLAVDPSSERSKGSILGDKTRMEKLSVNTNAFIRPSSSSGSLGGVARKTREAIILCEAAGFDTIVIETVGVGQSETAVHSMVDFFLLLMLAGAGDELQGIKRGIMEMADAVAITKADGNNIKKAEMAKQEYTNALHLFPPSSSTWIPKVLSCSSVSLKGIKDIWKTIEDYCYLTKENNYFNIRRSEQAKFWMYETINEKLKSNFFDNEKIKLQINDLEKKVLDNEVSSFQAAKLLLDNYFGQ